MKAVVWFFKDNRIVEKQVKEWNPSIEGYLRIWWNRDNIFDMTTRWLTAEEFALELRKGIPQSY